jgi:anti-sigma B factor antagonist
MHWTEIVERQSGAVTILEVRGHMTLADPESALYRHAARLAEDGQRRLVLNLRHVSYIDSVGIGEIVRTFLHLTQRGGMLTLCAVSPRTREVIEATHLDTVIKMFESEDHASNACLSSNPEP